MANARADQWTKAGCRCSEKIAQRDHAMAIEAGRSPSGVEKA